MVSINARTLYAEKCSGVVSVHDPAHVADILIHDAGKFTCVKEFVDVVCDVACDVHRHRRIKELYCIVGESYNEGISVLNTML